MPRFPWSDEADEAGPSAAARASRALPCPPAPQHLSATVACACTQRSRRGARAHAVPAHSTHGGGTRAKAAGGARLQELALLRPVPRHGDGVAVRFEEDEQPRVLGGDVPHLDHLGTAADLLELGNLRGCMWRERVREGLGGPSTRLDVSAGCRFCAPSCGGASSSSSWRGSRRPPPCPPPRRGPSRRPPRSSQPPCHHPPVDAGNTSHGSAEDFSRHRLQGPL